MCGEQSKVETKEHISKHTWNIHASSRPERGELTLGTRFPTGSSLVSQGTAIVRIPGDDAYFEE